ncbi:hypothetical protein G6F32_017526 [Rhizopus arrhizus]|nr:hypothetical protein G6F32_017526 [Rhizopus arrhizus]
MASLICQLRLALAMCFAGVVPAIGRPLSGPLVCSLLVQVLLPRSCRVSSRSLWPASSAPRVSALSMFTLWVDAL